MNALPVRKILEQMIETFTERSQQYKSNWNMVGELTAVLFPNGVPVELLRKPQFHLLELLLVKVSRYAVTDLTHRDSIHDAAVYATMCEAVHELEMETLDDLVCISDK